MDINEIRRICERVYRPIYNKDIEKWLKTQNFSEDAFLTDVAIEFLKYRRLNKFIKLRSDHLCVDKQHEVWKRWLDDVNKNPIMVIEEGYYLVYNDEVYVSPFVGFVEAMKFAREVLNLQPSMFIVQNYPNELPHGGL